MTVNHVMNFRGYATTKPKTGTAATKKSGIKKAAAKKNSTKTTKAVVKKSKKKAGPKKKAVKKRKVAVKPKTPSRPKVLDLSQARSITGYVVFIQNQLKSASGAEGVGVPVRFAKAVQEWKALPESEKQVITQINRRQINTGEQEG